MGQKCVLSKAAPGFQAATLSLGRGRRLGFTERFVNIPESSAINTVGNYRIASLPYR